MGPKRGAVLGLSLLLLAVPAAVAADKFPDEAKAILEKSDRVELYSLEPVEAKEGETLHGWKVLGKTVIKDKTRKAVLDALAKGIADPGKGGAKCFDPRHAIRASHGGKSVDLVICFECGWVYVFPDGKGQAVARVETDTIFQPVFDKALKDAGVPLAKKRKE
jgi:hypothetical protein